MITAATTSLDTAASGGTPKISTSIGVMSAPPPTPVRPTMKPTIRPPTAMGRSITSSSAGSRYPPDHGTTCARTAMSSGSRSNRYFDLDPRAGARARGHREDATARANPLAHPHDAQVTGGGRPVERPGIEPASVVSDRERHAVALAGQLHPDVAGGGMAEGVGDRFLDYAKAG